MSENWNGKWMLNGNCDELWNADTKFDTREEAIKYGISLLTKFNNMTDKEKESFDLMVDMHIQHDGKNITSFNVGKIVYAEISFNVDNILETIADNAYDEYGEYAEDYLRDVKNVHVEELEATINNWFHKYDYLPTFYGIECAETIYMDEIAEERIK